MNGYAAWLHGAVQEAPVGFPEDEGGRAVPGAVPVLPRWLHHARAGTTTPASLVTPHLLWERCLLLMEHVSGCRHLL